MISSETNLLLLSFSVFWMGILATLSPCPLGTNIAAVSIIAGGGGKTPQNAILTASAYGLGRILVHVLVGVLILRGFASTAEASSLMKIVASKIAGPIFMTLGVVLSGWMELRMPKGSSTIKKKILADGRSGPFRTFAIGCVFSLIPCPETAALFFGGLLPIAIQHNSFYLFPLLFGLGTGLPVMLAGFLLSMGINKLADGLGSVRSVEPFLRALTSTAFFLVGLYLTLSHVYHVL